MAVLKDDNFARRGRQQPQRRFVSALAFVLIFLSIALLVLSRLEHPYVKAVRDAATPVIAPIFSVVAGPLAPLRDFADRTASLFNSHDEIERLRAENQQLRSWEWRARDLEAQLAALGKLVKLVDEPATPFLTARVVADTAGPFARSVVIDVGTERGVRMGHPVINADGLIGRVVETSPGASRVLLVNDIDSRIPVVIGAGNVSAIAFGNNGSEPRLRHMERDAVVKPGDVVATSGRGGLFPRSLRFGEVRMAGQTPVVKPFANLNRLDFVSVLLFESPLLPLTRAGRTVTGSGRGGAAP